jgi:hypothetical protein
MTHTSNFDLMTSMYKIINYVLDEIDIMSSFNFLLHVLQHLTLISKKELHQRNYIPMIVKIYRESGKKQKE